MSDKEVLKKNLYMHEEEAENYEGDKSEIYNVREQERINSAIEEAKEQIETDSPTSKALDVGCGTGNVLEKLIPKFDCVVGIDLSKEMLSRAKLNHLDRGENLTLVRGRIANLPFPDNCFDMVSAYSVLHHLPSFSDPISEISRVLKEGGVFYVDHEPIGRGNLLVQLYIKTCDVLNGKHVDGLPPYEETEGLDRRLCDYQIHNEGDMGVPTSDIKEICKEQGFEICSARKYLTFGCEGENPFYRIFKPLIDSEWLFIGRRGED